MAYVNVPKDLTEVKTKVLFNLTKRQLVCFALAAVVGVPVFFLLRGTVGASASAIVMVALMLPFFLFAMYERNGQPLEKVVGNILRVNFLRPKERPYETRNYYALLMKQDKLNKEVSRIVKGTKTHPKAAKASEGRRRPGKGQ